jgi:hypothetical protein
MLVIIYSRALTVLLLYKFRVCKVIALEFVKKTFQNIMSRVYLKVIELESTNFTVLFSMGSCAAGVLRVAYSVFRVIALINEKKKNAIFNLCRIAHKHLTRRH